MVAFYFTFFALVAGVPCTIIDIPLSLLGNKVPLANIGKTVKSGTTKQLFRLILSISMNYRPFQALLRRLRDKEDNKCCPINLCRGTKYTSPPVQKLLNQVPPQDFQTLWFVSIIYRSFQAILDRFGTMKDLCIDLY